jgi:RNA polymerase sigma factor (sigma-70 family)
METTDDMALLREYAAHNSEAAFEELVSRRVHFVYAAALRQVRDPYLAEEVAQAVFIILAQKAGRIQGGTLLTGWLFKTTRFAALAHLRAAAKRRQHELEVQMQSDVQSTPPDPLWEQISPMLDEALTQLGEKDRQAVLLRFFENKSLAEVGSFLGTGEDTARKRVSRALEKLHRFFLKRGVASTTAIIAATLAANSAQAAPTALAKTVATAAIAKGTAAGGSTLVLVKGALKLMAWAKTKSAAAVAAAIILATGTTTAVVEVVQSARASGPPGIEGAWQGIGEIPQQHIKARGVFRIVKLNGTYRATLDIIDQGRKDIPFKLDYHYPAVHAEANSPGGDVRELEATVSADGMEISGTYTEPNHNLSIPLVLKRTANPDSVQEPFTAEECAPRRDSDLQGWWSGTLKDGNLSLLYTLKIVEVSPGTFRGQCDSVLEGLRNIPVLVNYSRPGVKLTVNGFGDSFAGNLENGNTISGTWTSDSGEHPMKFKSVDPHAEAVREQRRDYHYSNPGELQGHWKGILTADRNGNKVKLRLAVDVARMADGAFFGSLDSPDELKDDVVASSVLFTPPRVRLEWRGIGARFEGKLKDGKLSGTWISGGPGPLGSPAFMVFERDKQ